MAGSWLAALGQVTNEDHDDTDESIEGSAFDPSVFDSDPDDPDAVDPGIDGEGDGGEDQLIEDVDTEVGDDKEASTEVDLDVTSQEAFKILDDPSAFETYFTTCEEFDRVWKLADISKSTTNQETKEVLRLAGESYAAINGFQYSEEGFVDILKTIFNAIIDFFKMIVKKICDALKWIAQKLGAVEKDANDRLKEFEKNTDKIGEEETELTKKLADMAEKLEAEIAKKNPKIDSAEDASKATEDAFDILKSDITWRSNLSARMKLKVQNTVDKIPLIGKRAKERRAAKQTHEIMIAERYIKTVVECKLIMFSDRTALYLGHWDKSPAAQMTGKYIGSLTTWVGNVESVLLQAVSGANTAINAFKSSAPKTVGGSNSYDVVKMTKDIIHGVGHGGVIKIPRFPVWDEAIIDKTKGGDSKVTDGKTLKAEYAVINTLANTSPKSATILSGEISLAKPDDYNTILGILSKFKDAEPKFEDQEAKGKISASEEARKLLEKKYHLDQKTFYHSEFLKNFRVMIQDDYKTVFKLRGPINLLEDTFRSKVTRITDELSKSGAVLKQITRNEAQEGVVEGLKRLMKITQKLSMIIIYPVTGLVAVIGKDVNVAVNQMNAVVEASNRLAKVVSQIVDAAQIDQTDSLRKQLNSAVSLKNIEKEADEYNEENPPEEAAS